MTVQQLIDLLSEFPPSLPVACGEFQHNAMRVSVEKTPVSSYDYVWVR